jgi:4-hydroxybenzoate polyprenyltransferase
MLPPVATAGFGGLLAGEFDAVPGALHAAAVFFAVYTAHVGDGYVDFYVRDEDDDHPLTARGCRLAFAGATAAFAACLAGLWWTVGPGAAALTLPCWLLGALHAPLLDRNPVTATVGYPLGVALALLGGHYAQAGRLTPLALAFAGVFLVVLSGVKVVDDAQDYAYDRSIDKRTVAVAVGTHTARRVADGLVVTGLLGVVALAATGVVPRASAAASAVFAPVVLVARRADPELATMLLVRGAYLFLAALLAATWLAPG